MIVTIDGPSGTGKSTVAKKVAEVLGFSFFDTGALYRSFAWWATENKIDPLGLHLVSIPFSFSIEEGKDKRYRVSDRDITEVIRSKEITESASKMAAIPEVRAFLLPIQRKAVSSRNYVFEGRDVGSVVFPDAEAKFFLTAREEVRAQRRYRELLSRFPGIAYEEVAASLRERDERDASRETAPLRCPEGALVIDTSDLGIDEVTEMICQHVVRESKQCRGG